MNSLGYSTQQWPAKRTELIFGSIGHILGLFAASAFLVACMFRFSLPELPITFFFYCIPAALFALPFYFGGAKLAYGRIKQQFPKWGPSPRHTIAIIGACLFAVLPYLILGALFALVMPTLKKG